MKGVDHKPVRLEKSEADHQKMAVELPEYDEDACEEYDEDGQDDYDDDEAAMDEMMYFDDSTPRDEVKMRIKDEVLAKEVRNQVMSMKYMRSKQGASAKKNELKTMAADMKQKAHEQRKMRKEEYERGVAICDAILQHMHERKVSMGEMAPWEQLMAGICSMPLVDNHEPTSTDVDHAHFEWHQHEQGAGSSKQHEANNMGPNNEYFDWDELEAHECNEAGIHVNHEYFDWDELEKSIRNESKKRRLQFMRSTAMMNLEIMRKADEIKARRKRQRKQSYEDMTGMKEMRRSKMNEAW